MTIVTLGKTLRWITAAMAIHGALPHLLEAQEPATVLSVDIVDAAGQPLPARAWVDVSPVDVSPVDVSPVDVSVTGPGDTGVTPKRLFEPSAPATCTPYPRDRSFTCDGHFEMDVPSGHAVVHVERGKEYRPVNHPVDVKTGQRNELKIHLERWIDMPAEGWYSGDLHVHFGADDARVLRQLSLADDVHVTPAFTYWYRGNEKSWPSQWPAFSEGEPLSVDPTHLVTRTAIELERIRGTAAPGASVGASFLFNLAQPVTAERFGEHFPTDTELCLQARQHSPDVVIDTDKPLWAETVVGAALGVYDTVQICHNHYNRSRTLTGGWGMIGPLAPGESNAAAGDGLFHRTNAVYYRLLNCGFRLGVSGGSAVGVMPAPAGHQRVYAQIDGPLTAERFWAAVKAGRSFASGGPMLTMTANGQPIGATLKRPSSDSEAMVVRARVRSIDRLEALELVHDGVVVETIHLAGKPQSVVLDREETWSLRPRKSGWIAARVLFRAADGLLRQAHTSPVYIVVDEKPIDRRTDALYMIRWIDRLTDIANRPDRFPTPADRQGVLAIYGRARTVYEKIAIRE